METASSVAPSVAESTRSQINIKLETNQTKAQLKTLLKNVDQGNPPNYLTLIVDKSGKIKTEVFF
jgi:hypothetical protein